MPRVVSRRSSTPWRWDKSEKTKSAASSSERLRPWRGRAAPVVSAGSGVRFRCSRVLGSPLLVARCSRPRRSDRCAHGFPAPSLPPDRRFGPDFKVCLLSCSKFQAFTQKFVCGDLLCPETEERQPPHPPCASVALRTPRWERPSLPTSGQFLGCFFLAVRGLLGVFKHLCNMKFIFLKKFTFF